MTAPEANMTVQCGLGNQGFVLGVNCCNSDQPGCAIAATEANSGLGCGGAYVGHVEVFVGPPCFGFGVKGPRMVVLKVVWLGKSGLYLEPLSRF